MSILQQIEKSLLESDENVSENDFRAALLIFRRALWSKVASTQGGENKAFKSGRDLSELVKKHTGIDPFYLYENAI